MLTATEPITVTISHRLGREEAKRRIDSGLASVRAEVAPYVKTLDYTWDDHRLDFRVVAMMQTITGRIEVYEDFVKVELALPRRVVASDARSAEARRAEQELLMEALRQSVSKAGARPKAKRASSKRGAA